jgi:hypothetical protein
MFSQIRRINVNKMVMPIRKLSQCNNNNNNNKDVKYDMIISELQDVNSRLGSMMKFVMPAAGFYIGTGIGTFFVSLVTMLK